MAILYTSRKLKKGQSLVEVVVAMFILMIVFVSMATLIIQSLNLVMMSRSRTEVTALAQRSMSNAIMQLKSACPAVAPTGLPKDLTLPADISGDQNLVRYGISHISETVAALDPGDQPTGTGVSTLPLNFYKVTVTITWRYKGAAADSTYYVTQLVEQ
jgi:type II secretory pathway pseudopilin PulG